MSLILDALNRSRQDANAVPGLDTQHIAAPLARERRPYLLWAALALCGVVIAVLVVDRLRTPAAPAQDIGAPVAQLSQNLGSVASSVTNELKARAAAGQAQQATAPAQPSPQTPTAQPVAQTQSQQPAPPVPTPVEPVVQTALASPEVPAPPQPAAQGAVVSAEPARPQPAPARVANAQAARSVAAVSNVPEQDEEVAQLYANPDTSDVAPTRSRLQSAADETEEPVDLDRILKLAQEEMQNAKLEDIGVPFIADLSQHTKDAIPTIYYQKHDYSSDPAVSSVTLNGNALRTGGTLPSGVKVEEILRDSVVLNFQGTQFRLRALNSWVNL